MDAKTPERAESLILETARLRVRELSVRDDAFMLELVNEPGWHRFIGDRGIATLEAAREYIRKKVRASYSRHGHGLWCVELAASREAIGICGLVRRSELPGPDLGFAFLARHQGEGFALEAARAVMLHARHALGVGRILAVTSPDNERSLRLLARLGFTRHATVRLDGVGAESLLFVSDRAEGDRA